MRGDRLREMRVIARNTSGPVRRLDARFANAYVNRGFVRYVMGDYDRAIADYDEAIRLNGNLAVAYNNRGAAYNAKRDYDHAIADLNQAIHLTPKLANASNTALATAAGAGTVDTDPIPFAPSGLVGDGTSCVSRRSVGIS